MALAARGEQRGQGGRAGPQQVLVVAGRGQWVPGGRVDEVADGGPAEVDDGLPSGVWVPCHVQPLVMVVVLPLLLVAERVLSARQATHGTKHCGHALGGLGTGQPRTSRCWHGCGAVDLGM